MNDLEFTEQIAKNVVKSAALMHEIHLVVNFILTKNIFVKQWDRPVSAEKCWFIEPKEFTWSLSSQFVFLSCFTYQWEIVQDFIRNSIRPNSFWESMGPLIINYNTNSAHTTIIIDTPIHDMSKIMWWFNWASAVMCGKQINSWILSPFLRLSLARWDIFC